MAAVVVVIVGSSVLLLFEEGSAVAWLWLEILIGLALYVLDNVGQIERCALATDS